ncbi:DUF2523 family protein [Acinetobacter tjernbergiae]|uniref:DUF2523 domain-containing protein n=1 Tax=Acinetobacter tjernbergiae DSM 14971 = CIP 107465 TaxID=1120928 RepID=V2UBJ9_9GAMM|nr:DUF2523 family protein [Acinetobacter tjernbergiae]ESK51863.1 hypothetical protein F990_03533 [Acinetobacter tjernbergiae DSM 14971 = CIP 107465]
MPQIILAILGSFASSFLFRILAGAGISVYSYTKIQQYMDLFINSIIQQTSRLPASFLQLLGLAGFDTYLSIVLCALSAATFIIAMKLFVGKSA